MGEQELHRRCRPQKEVTTKNATGLTEKWRSGVESFHLATTANLVGSGGTNSLSFFGSPPVDGVTLQRVSPELILSIRACSRQFTGM